jgi:hypothetical protein
MGSFAGVSIDAQNLEQAVSLAEQKKILAEQTREYQLSQSLLDYRNSLPPMVSDVKISMPQYDSSNNFLVEKKPYLVVQEFNILNKWENRMGQSGVQELPQPKNTVIFLPVETYQVDLQNQYDVALKDGKLKPLEIIRVESLVDKQDGYCQKETYNYGDLRPTVMRPPCRTVKKGEILKGYIVSGTFSPYDASGFQNNKPVLSFNEFKVFNSNDKSNAIENLTEIKRRNGDNTKIMIAVAFILGYLLSKK